ncbi:FAH family protein [Streptomyces sp. NPDC052299]|uniref:FAH family protein n=1 Tax=Streptomyces sp. NPDC052299 TaxID=3155054 RepID=UPI003415F956
MTTVYEFDHRDRRWFGFEEPGAAKGAVRLYPCGPGELASLLADAEGDVTALTSGREPVEVPAADREALRARVPLLPGHLGDALVSGFMMTHNVKIGTVTADQPTWFFKGLGERLRLPGEPLSVPGDAVAVCEEAEVVLVYVGAPGTGRPRYAGYTFGNDLTDIGRFKQHNGHLSYAKLCDAAIAPGLRLGPPPAQVTGATTIERDGVSVWKGTFTTGTDALYYDLDTMMTNLFGYETLHTPGRVHYVYLGADRGSFHGGHVMADGDRVTLDFSSHGVTLANTVARS